MTDPRDDGDDADPPTEGGPTEVDSVADDRSDDGPGSEDGLREAPGTTDGAADHAGEANAATTGATSESAERSVFAADVDTPGEPRTLDSRVRISWMVGPLFGAVAAALAAMAVTYGVGFEFLPFRREVATLAAGGVVFLLVAAYGVIRTVYLYRSWRYVVRDESLYLTRGVFTKVQTVVPYVRVQHIDTRRSAFERVLGLSRLVVYTAGSRGADVSIPGLEPAHAEELQSRLERLANASEDEDAV